MYLFTFLATWVGGVFIIGIAESVYNPTKGVTWALIPLQMSISFIIGKYVSLLHAGSQYALFEIHKKQMHLSQDLIKECSKHVARAACQLNIQTNIRHD